MQRCEQRRETQLPRSALKPWWPRCLCATKVRRSRLEPLEGQVVIAAVRIELGYQQRLFGSSRLDHCGQRRVGLGRALQGVECQCATLLHDGSQRLPAAEVECLRKVLVCDQGQTKVVIEYR